MRVIEGMQERVGAGLGDFEHRPILRRSGRSGAGCAIEIPVRGRHQSGKRLVAIGCAGTVELVQHRDRPGGAEFKNNPAGICNRPAAAGGAIQKPIAALNHGPEGEASMGRVKTVDDLNGSGRRHPEDGSETGSSSLSGAVEISIFRQEKRRVACAGSEVRQ